MVSVRPPRAVSIDQLIRGDLKCMVSYRVELSRSISASQRPCSSFRSSSLPMVTSDETRPVEEPRTPRPRLPHCATPDDRTWPSWRSSRVGRKRCVIIRHRRDALDEEKRANKRRQRGDLMGLNNSDLCRGAACCSDKQIFKNGKCWLERS